MKDCYRKYSPPGTEIRAERAAMYFAFDALEICREEHEPLQEDISVDEFPEMYTGPEFDIDIA